MTPQQRREAKNKRRANRASKSEIKSAPPKESRMPPGVTLSDLSDNPDMAGVPDDPAGPGQMLIIHDFEAVAKEALQPTPHGRRKLAALMKAVENSRMVMVQEENPGPYMAKLQPMLSKGRKFFDHRSLSSTEPQP